MGFTNTDHPGIELPSELTLLRQTYEKAESIEKVQIVKLATFSDDYGGWFKENLRLTADGFVQTFFDLGIQFKFIQSNTSFLAPGTRRFWHIHPEQNEIWTTNGTLLLGLVDFRKGSSTYLKQMKVVLSQDKMIFIPAGVAHGFINPNQSSVTLTYFTDKFFVGDENTQECRIDSANLSYDFVKPEEL
jgi:dTDP-4-dehydrorhamnose 3,5-epimerase-like enzyme